MKSYGAEWQLLKARTVLMRYRVRSYCGLLLCGTRRRARFVARLLGSKYKQIPAVRAAVDTWHCIKFWGPDPEDTRRTILLCDLWVEADTVVRQLAYKWEQLDKRNQADWTRGQNTSGLRRPHSSIDVPF